MLGRKFTPAEVAILEVIPRYLTNFGELVLDMKLKRSAEPRTGVA